MGYNYKDYLKIYMKFILCTKNNLLKNFLDINLDNYLMDYDDVYLVGSLPGAYNNYLNYSNPEIIKKGI